jgi:hypothetical protein
MTEFTSPLIERCKKIIKPLAAQVAVWSADVSMTPMYEWTEDDEFERLRVIYEYREKMTKATLEGQIMAEKRVRRERWLQWVADQPQEFRDRLAEKKRRRAEFEKLSKERLYQMRMGAWHAWPRQDQLVWCKQAVTETVFRAHELAKLRRKTRLDAYKTENLMIVVNALQPVEKHCWDRVGRLVRIPTREEVIESKKPSVGGMKKMKIPTKLEIEIDKKRMLKGFADWLAT